MSTREIHSSVSFLFCRKCSATVSAIACQVFPNCTFFFYDAQKDVSTHIYYAQLTALSSPWNSCWTLFPRGSCRPHPTAKGNEAVDLQVPVERERLK